MSDTAPELRLGVIGGCLTHQPGIALSQLYQRRLASTLSADTGVRLRVAIARGWEDRYEERLTELMRRAVLDGVLLHMRVTFQRKAGLLAIREVDGKRQYVVHPHLFRRAPAAPVALRVAQRDIDQDADLHQAPLWGPRIGGLRVFDLNWVAGSMLGLDRWAIADELRMLERCRNLCSVQGIPLIILGPTPVGNSPWRNRLCGQMNRALRQRAAACELPLVCIDSLSDDAGQPLLKRDGIHLTAHGHAYVANLLREPLAAWALERLAFVSKKVG